MKGQQTAQLNRTALCPSQDLPTHFMMLVAINGLRLRRRVQVRPFPRPLGRDGKLPLLSSCADSFHAVNGHRGTVLRDNFFVNSGVALCPLAALCSSTKHACM